jgi:hypothetical protein
MSFLRTLPKVLGYSGLLISNLVSFILALIPGFGSDYDAEDDDTPAGGDVDNWHPGYGNGPAFTPPGQNKPKKGIGGANNEDFIIFDGIDDLLQADYILQQPYTLFIAIEIVTTADGEIILDGGDAGIGTIYNDGGYWALDSGTPLVSTIDVLPGFYIIKATFDGANSELVVNRSTPLIGDTGSSTEPGGITIGGGAGDTNHSEVNYYEIVVFEDSVNTANTSTVFEYLEDEYLGEIEGWSPRQMNASTLHLWVQVDDSDANQLNTNAGSPAVEDADPIGYMTSSYPAPANMYALDYRFEVEKGALILGHWSATAQSSRSYMRHDKSGDWLLNGNKTFLTIVMGNFVGNIDNTENGAVVRIAGSSANPYGLYIHRNDANGGYCWRLYKNSDEIYDSSYSAIDTLLPTNPTILTYVLDASSVSNPTPTELYVNGQQVIDVSMDSIYSLEGTSVEFQWGRHQVGSISDGDQTFGAAYEFMHYKEGDTYRTLIEQYLATKYGVSLS